MGGWRTPERDRTIWEGILEGASLKAQNGKTVTAIITTATITHTLTFVNGILVDYSESGG